MKCLFFIVPIFVMIFAHLKLTIGNSKESEIFYDTFVKNAKEYTQIDEIDNDIKVKELISEMDASKLIIIFNSIDKYKDEIESLINQANSIGAIVWLIAMDADHSN